MSEPAELTLDELRRHPPPPIINGDKDRHGRLLLAAGSNQTPGSSVVAATAALRSGCGKVSIATVEPMAPHVALAVPEARVIALPVGRDGDLSSEAIEQLVEALPDYDAVVAGPGMKQGEACSRLANRLLEAGLDRLVLDAAMLYSLNERARKARSARSLMLLPHDREMSALIGCSEDEVNRAPLRCGRECAERYDALVLAKGAQSHAVAPDGAAWKYSGGSPGLGVAGSGDALAGIIGGLLARGAAPLTALLWAVWLHGEAGARLAAKIGPVGFLAREISAEIPAILAEAYSFE